MPIQSIILNFSLSSSNHQSWFTMPCGCLCTRMLCMCLFPNIRKSFSFLALFPCIFVMDFSSISCCYCSESVFYLSPFEVGYCWETCWLSFCILATSNSIAHIHVSLFSTLLQLLLFLACRFLWFFCFCIWMWFQCNTLNRSIFILLYKYIYGYKYAIHIIYCVCDWTQRQWPNTAAKDAATEKCI